MTIERSTVPLRKIIKIKSRDEPTLSQTNRLCTFSKTKPNRNHILSTIHQLDNNIQIRLKLTKLDKILDFS